MPRPEFRVISTELSPLPGVPSQVTVAFDDTIFTVRCATEDVDPPEYARLKRVAAGWMVEHLEGQYEEVKRAGGRLRWLLRGYRKMAKPPMVATGVEQAGRGRPSVAREGKAG